MSGNCHNMTMMGTPNAGESSKPAIPNMPRDFGIDFDILGKLMTEREDSELENWWSVESEQGRRSNDVAGSSVVTSNSDDSQKIIIYSTSSWSIFQATSLSKLKLPRKILPLIFSDDPGKPWWLDVQNPSMEEIRLLCSAFRVHPLTVEDILNRETIEKIDQFNTYYFTCLGSCHFSESESGLSKDPEKIYQPYPIYMIVFPAGTLSISFNRSEHGNRVLRRIELLARRFNITSDWIFYAFADNIVDSFLPSIFKLEKAVNAIEDQVYTNRNDDMQEFVYEIELARKAVSWLWRLLGGKTSVLLNFEKHRCMEKGLCEEEELSEEENPCEGRNFNEGNFCDENQNQGYNTNYDLRLYINDVQGHVASMNSSLEHFESLLSRSEANYLARAEIDLINQTERLNKFLGFITVLETILSFYEIISSLLGMNVDEDAPLFVESSYAFYYILGTEVVLAIVLMVIAKKLRWH